MARDALLSEKGESILIVRVELDNLMCNPDNTPTGSTSGR